MAKGKRTKGQTKIYKIIHRKQNEDRLMYSGVSTPVFISMDLSIVNL